MSSHKTNVKPSWIKRLINYFGFIEVPIKVNCWFCNQDAFILPGTKDTVAHWYCHLCENTNAIDANGEIIDPSPYETAQGSKIQSNTPRRNTTINASTNKQDLCDNCQRNQALIYDIMSKYIPDESDPEYIYRCENADAENARLQRKYKLCDQCQAHVDMVVAEKMEYLSVRSMNRSFSKSIEEVIVPKRPSKFKYKMQGLIWFITHAYILTLSVYELLYPSKWAGTDLSQFLYSSNIIEDLWKSFHNLNLTTLFHWNTYAVIVNSVLVNLISVITFDYHPKVTLFHYEKVKNWKTYKDLQVMLFLLRFAIPLMIITNSSKKLLISAIVTYCIVLLASLYIVKIVGATLKKEVGSFLEESNNNNNNNNSSNNNNNDDKNIIDDDGDVSMAEASVMDEPMSIPSYEDPVDSLANKIAPYRFF